MKIGYTTTKIPTAYTDRILKFCEKSGQSLSFHVNAALENYMNDVFPEWERKLADPPGKK